MDGTRNANGVERKCGGSGACGGREVWEGGDGDLGGVIYREQSMAGWKQAALGASSRFRGDEQESEVEIGGWEGVSWKKPSGANLWDLNVIRQKRRVLGDIRIKVELNELIYIYQISAEYHHAEHLHLSIYTYP